MKSSSGINIGNGNNSQQNRKTTTTSFSSASSSAYINKRVTKTNTTLIQPSHLHQNDVKQQLNEFIQPASSSFTTSISSFQSESLSSKFKFEITPESVNHLNRQQTINQRRPRIQWVTRHASLHTPNKTSSATSSLILTNSSIDLHTSSMAMNLKKDIIDTSNVSITEMTTKDFDDEYQPYADQTINPDDPDQGLKCTSMNVITSDDDDDNTEKAGVDQSSQAILADEKPKKKMKAKIKSASKRPKQTNATQTTQLILSSSPPNRTSSNADLTAGTKSAPSPTKMDDNTLGKHLITVDTSKARSNLDVIRMCIRELGWKEVIEKLFN
jgi:hypothetical protein